MEAFQPFNAEYIDDPLRQAERRVYEELLNCKLPGLFIHEWKFNQQFAEVDFVVWIEGVALFAIQVEGGFGIDVFVEQEVDSGFPVRR